MVITVMVKSPPPTRRCQVRQALVLTLCTAAHPTHTHIHTHCRFSECVWCLWCACLLASPTGDVPSGLHSRLE